MPRRIPVLMAVILQTSWAMADETDDAVDEIRQLLRHHRIDRGMFPEDRFDPASFDPKEFDPFAIRSTWEAVQDDVREIIERRLRLNDASLRGQLTIHFAQPDDVATPGAYRVVFLAWEPVSVILKRALELPDVCFPRVQERHATRQGGEDSLSVAWADIGVATGKFATSVGLTEQPYRFSLNAPLIRDDKVQMVTSWKRRGSIGSYELYWRLFFQVKRSPDVPGQILVSVRAQCGRLLPGARTSDMTFLGSDEDDDRYNLALGLARPGVSSYRAEDGTAYPIVDEPATSDTVGLANTLLEQYMAYLTE